MSSSSRGRWMQGPCGHAGCWDCAQTPARAGGAAAGGVRAAGRCPCGGHVGWRDTRLESQRLAWPRAPAQCPNRDELRAPRLVPASPAWDACVRTVPGGPGADAAGVWGAARGPVQPRPRCLTGAAGGLAVTRWPASWGRLGEEARRAVGSTSSVPKGPQSGIGPESHTFGNRAFVFMSGEAHLRQDLVGGAWRGGGSGICQSVSQEGGGEGVPPTRCRFRGFRGAVEPVRLGLPRGSLEGGVPRRSEAGGVQGPAQPGAWLPSRAASLCGACKCCAGVCGRPGPPLHWDLLSPCIDPHGASGCRVRQLTGWVC